jgi:hypothetical protein
MITAKAAHLPERGLISIKALRKRTYCSLDKYQKEQLCLGRFRQKRPPFGVSPEEETSPQNKAANSDR